MRTTSHGIWLMLWSLCAGCAESEQIAGKAIFTKFYVGAEETLILDTGNDGKEYQEPHGDRWSATCWGRDPVSMSVIDVTRMNAPGYEAGFYNIFIAWYSDGRVTSREFNVYLDFKYERFFGLCDVSLEQTSDDPYAAEISVSTCEMQATDTRGRLESAVFHLKACRPD